MIAFNIVIINLHYVKKEKILSKLLTLKGWNFIIVIVGGVYEIIGIFVVKEGKTDPLNCDVRATKTRF